MSNVHVVVGGQYGSEGKGAVAAALAKRIRSEDARTPIGVRVGGPNAGHTAYDPNGGRWALRQLPVTAVTHHDSLLVIAAGSEIDVEVLQGEIDAIEMKLGWPVRERLCIDISATLIEPEHKLAESDAELTDRIGSTGKGIGAARAARLMRQATTLGQTDELPGWTAGDAVLSAMLSRPGNAVIVEGTQGYGLGLHTPNYPQVTSGDARAIDFLAQAGISPWDPAVDELTVWVVLRAYPIRVAGNSGPLQDETTWEALGLPPEQTTVTKKTRRVGMWDWDLAQAAVHANGVNVKLALTMVDHRDSGISGISTRDELTERADPSTLAWLQTVERRLDAPIHYIGTGPDSGVWDPMVGTADHISAAR